MERCKECNILVRTDDNAVSHCPICEGRIIPCSTCDLPECCDDDFICVRFKIKIKD
jgi:hypothetical protein